MPFEAPTYLELAARRLQNKRRLKKPIAPKPPVSIEREYIRDLIPYLETISHQISMRLIPALPLLASEFDSMRTIKRDAAPDEVARLMRQVAVSVEEEWSPEAIGRIAAQKGMSVARYNSMIIKNNIKKLIGVDVFFANDGLAGEIALFTVNNTSLIQSIASESFRKVETMVYQGFQDGTRVEDISKQVLKFVDPSVGNTRARANLIARDQVSKLNGNLTYSRQTDLGIKRYVWRTVGDERVRETHRAHDGKKFSWDDPPAETGHPGEDYQCRCYAEPVLEDLVPGMAIDEE